MKLETWAVEKVRPYEKNPRKNDGAVEAVAAIIREFGFRVPIVVDRHGVIITGHTRRLAAIKLGLESVPVHVASDLKPDQVRALRIADNKTHELSSWDKELLHAELESLNLEDFDLTLLGFDADDLSAAMADIGTDGLVDPDDVPAQPDAATTVPGDIWVLGNHRLMCGDSSKPDDLDRLLDGQPIHLVNTDPPYNVNVEPRSNNAINAGLSSFTTLQAQRPGAGSQQRGDAAVLGKRASTHKKLRAKDRPLANDLVTTEQFDALLDAWFSNIARVLVDGGGFYIWGGYANCGNYPPVLKRCKLYFSQAVIWIKEHPVINRKDFMGNHEWCFYGWKEGAAHRFFGPNNATDTWSIKKVNPQSMVHLTEKPVELAKRAIEFSSRPGENVLDLFGGSGSTLIGAEMTGRHAFLMELDTLYCDVIVQRWEKFTGRKAERLPAKDAAEEKAATSVAAGSKA